MAFKNTPYLYDLLIIVNELTAIKTIQETFKRETNVLYILDVYIHLSKIPVALYKNVVGPPPPPVLCTWLYKTD